MRWSRLLIFSAYTMAFKCTYNEKFISVRSGDHGDHAIGPRRSIHLPGKYSSNHELGDRNGVGHHLVEICRENTLVKHSLSLSSVILPPKKNGPNDCCFPYVINPFIWGWYRSSTVNLLIDFAINVKVGFIAEQNGRRKQCVLE